MGVRACRPGHPQPLEGGWPSLGDGGLSQKSKALSSWRRGAAVVIVRPGRMGGSLLVRGLSCRRTTAAAVEARVVLGREDGASMVARRLSSRRFSEVSAACSISASQGGTFRAGPPRITICYEAASPDQSLSFLGSGWDGKVDMLVRGRARKRRRLGPSAAMTCWAPSTSLAAAASEAAAVAAACASEVRREGLAVPDAVPAAVSGRLVTPLGPGGAGDWMHCRIWFRRTSWAAGAFTPLRTMILMAGEWQAKGEGSDLLDRESENGCDTTREWE